MLLIAPSLAKVQAAIESGSKSMNDPTYEEYLTFFDDVYEKMQNHYYQQIDPRKFDKFIEHFRTQIYGKLKSENKSSQFIKWRSAAFMVEALRSQEDIFSAFYPPKPAKEYEETSLGKKMDIGIQGQLIEGEFKVEFVEPRSDAYEKGLRQEALLLAFNDQAITELDETQLHDFLNPLVGDTVTLTYKPSESDAPMTIEVISQEYFKQSVFPFETDLGGIYGIQIERFNRKTGEDVFRFLNHFRQKSDIRGLIIDLRDNPGGPPLAARELSSFFLEPGSPFAYFKQKETILATLDVPKIPEQFHYDGPIAILINEKSGSASELFSGILQRQNRAVLVGTNSAGQVMLKSMYHFDDESMLLLVSGRGHHPDGHVFSFSGLIPNRYIENEVANTDESIDVAKQYLVYVHLKNSGQLDKLKFDRH